MYEYTKSFPCTVIKCYPCDVRLFVYLSGCLFVCLFAYLFICVFVCLFVILFLLLDTKVFVNLDLIAMLIYKTINPCKGRQLIKKTVDFLRGFISLELTCHLHMKKNL